MSEWTYTTDLGGVIAWLLAALSACWAAYQRGRHSGVLEAERIIKQATGED